MKKSIKRVIAAVAALSLVFAVTACGPSTQNESGAVSYWKPLDSNTSQIASNLGDTPFGKKLSEVTGIEVEYQHPAKAGADEKFNLLIASGKLPDIIEFTWLKSYQGGPAKALADGIIQEIDIKNEAPNLYAYLQANPDIDRMCKTDDGKYFGFPFVRGDEYLLTNAGPYMRDDLLKKHGMELPETIAEWEAAFEVLKNEVSGSPAHTNIVNTLGSYILPAFGVIGPPLLYVEDGQVKYGPMEKGYEEGIRLMNSWYEKGYLPKDFSSATGAAADILNSVNAVSTGACGSGVGKIMAAKPTESFSITGVKIPVLNKGDKPFYGNYSNPVTGLFACITRDARDKEKCLKLLDYGYSEEGKMLFNFGIEGESYTMIDGYPTYTELVTKNPEGLSMAVAMSKYTQSHTEGPFVQDKRYMEQYAALPQQKTSLDNWLYTDAAKHAMPPINISLERQTELASSIDAIQTYVEEMQTKFIMGTEPLENFDKFREGLKARNVEKYIQYNQEAYDRYMKR